MHAIDRKRAEEQSMREEGEEQARRNAESAIDKV